MQFLVMVCYLPTYEKLNILWTHFISFESNSHKTRYIVFYWIEAGWEDPLVRIIYIRPTLNIPRGVNKGRPSSYYMPRTETAEILDELAVIWQIQFEPRGTRDMAVQNQFGVKIYHAYNLGKVKPTRLKFFTFFQVSFI